MNRTILHIEVLGRTNIGRCLERTTYRITHCRDAEQLKPHLEELFPANAGWTFTPGPWDPGCGAYVSKLVTKIDSSD